LVWMCFDWSGVQHRSYQIRIGLGRCAQGGGLYQERIHLPALRQENLGAYGSRLHVTLHTDDESGSSDAYLPFISTREHSPLSSRPKLHAPYWDSAWPWAKRGLYSKHLRSSYAKCGILAVSASSRHKCTSQVRSSKSRIHVCCS